MNEQQIRHLQYQLSVIEQIDTDLMVYGDDEIERKHLERDRALQVITLKYSMKEMLK